MPGSFWCSSRLPMMRTGESDGLSTMNIGLRRPGWGRSPAKGPASPSVAKGGRREIDEGSLRSGTRRVVENDHQDASGRSGAGAPDILPAIKAIDNGFSAEMQ